VLYIRKLILLANLIDIIPSFVQLQSYKSFALKREIRLKRAKSLKEPLTRKESSLFPLYQKEG
jgi:hypothetical protein